MPPLSSRYILCLRFSPFYHLSLPIIWVIPSDILLLSLPRLVFESISGKSIDSVWGSFFSRRKSPNPSFTLANDLLFLFCVALMLGFLGETDSILPSLLAGWKDNIILSGFLPIYLLHFGSLRSAAQSIFPIDSRIFVSPLWTIQWLNRWIKTRVLR